MVRLCLLVLSGLPGSGKSHLTCQLAAHKQTDQQHCIDIIPVEYDQLLSTDVEKGLIYSGECLWKQYRADIVKCVDCLVESLLKDSVTVPLSKPEDVHTELWTKFSALVKSKMPTETKKAERQCIVIDDNMYYRSMRYDYYQLARKYNISFTQVHVNSEVTTALQRNNQRKVKVTEDVIITMATKMEAPDPVCNTWERYSMCVNGDDDHLGPILELVNTALQDPVQPLEVEDTEMKNQSRLVCSESLIHQSDQILRKLVGEHMIQAKECHLSKEQMREVSYTLQHSRKQLLASLKDGSLLVPSHLVSIVTDMSKDSESELYTFLRSQFTISVEDR